MLRFVGHYSPCLVSIRKSGMIRRRENKWNFTRFFRISGLSILIALMLKWCCVRHKNVDDDDDDESYVMGETERQRFRAETRLNTAMEMSKLREYVMKNKKTVMGKLSERGRRRMLEWVGE